MTERFDVIVIGAGQAGLAISRELGLAGVDHVVLERGAVAERWRSERWTSLRLLTPTGLSALPGLAHRGNAEGFLHKDEVTAYLENYARHVAAPVRTHTRVGELACVDGRFRVTCDGTVVEARSVVIATGACDLPKVPAWAPDLPATVRQVTTREYTAPDDLDPGGVLVVGASATGVQLAEEIHLSGRPVTLAAGAHVCLPRRYRGRDILQWMETAGLLSERRNPEYPDARAMRQPSLQLVGDATRNIDIGTLRAAGIRCVGRAVGSDGAQVALSGDLAREMNAAAARMEQVLARIDAHIAHDGIDAPARVGVTPPVPPATEPTALDLARDNIRTVVWATGFRRDYGWLKAPALTAEGELRHAGGVTPVPGLYALGLPFQRRRNSTFIGGVGADAADIADLISIHLGQRPARAA